MAINYPQRYDDDFINTVKKVIDHVNEQGMALQDLIVKGQLTPQQYAQLLTVLNGLMKSGEIDKFDLSEELRTELGSIDRTVFNLDKRINDIVTSPANVTQEEIIDARDGKESLRENIDSIKASMSESALNIVPDGDFKETAAWGGSADTSVSNGELSITYSGTTGYYRATHPEPSKKPIKTGDILYGRCLFYSDDPSNIVWLAFSESREYTNERFSPYFDITTGEWIQQSGILQSNGAGDGIIIKGQVSDKTQSSGTTFKVRDLMWLNLTDIFGKGNEPTKEEMDYIFDSLNVSFWREYFKVDLFKIYHQMSKVTLNDFLTSENEEWII